MEIELYGTGKGIRLCGHGAMRALIPIVLVLALLLSVVQPALADENCGQDGCPEHSTDAARFTSIVRVNSRSAPERGNTAVQIDWTTGYESFTAGFNILVPTAGDFTQANSSLIPSEAIYSMEPQSYSTVVAMGGDEFYLEVVTITDENHRVGPFAVGETVGQVPQAQEVDWETISAASAAMDEQEQVLLATQVNAALDAVRGPAPSPDDPLVEQSAGDLGEWNINLSFVAGGSSTVRSAAVDIPALTQQAVIELHVVEDGIHRVTHEDLLNEGLDLTGVPSAYLALSNQGNPVRIRLVAAQHWGPGASFEFIGHGLDTLYTDTNVYLLKVEPAAAFRTFRDLRAPDMDATAPTHYRERVRIEKNSLWTPVAFTDPWIWAYKTARPGRQQRVIFSFDDIDAVSEDGPLPTIEAEVFGSTEGQHHVTVSLNDQQVLDFTFTDRFAHTASQEFDSAILQNGENAGIWRLPGDTGESYDTVGLEEIALEYNRAFVAKDDELTFSGNAPLFKVDGLSSDQVSVFSIYRDRVWVMGQVNTAASNNGYEFEAAVRGWGADARYYVASEGAIHTPVLRAGRSHTDITSGLYDFIVISHPDFLGGLQELVDVRTEQGFSVRLVDVFDIYAQFGFGIFGADAIHDYVQHAVQQMGADHFLLVGADMMDYRNYIYPSAVSFLPSPYTRTYTEQNFMPADPLYTDIDGNRIPDAAIGRFPVNTVEELAVLVQKTLAYTPQGRTAMFTADQHDGPDYTAYSRGFASQLPDTWQDSEAFLEGSTAAVERPKISAAINAGLGLVHYLGHSNPDRWTFSGLYSIGSINALSNSGKPTIAIQLGCWSSMDVHPAINSMSAAWVLADDKGAAASFGATGLTAVGSDVAIGNALAQRIAQPGKTIGTALTEAKAEVGGSSPEADVVLGWTLFGDPTLVMDP